MTRRQHYLFAQKYLPEVFYQNPNLVIEYLKNDIGSEYLSQLWQNTADEFSLDETDVIDPTGLRIDYRENEDYRLIVISLPSPEVSPEAYFVAMWSNYSSKYQGEAFRYFTLELEEDIDSQDNGVSGFPPTMFCGRARGGKHINYGNGSGVALDGFVESIEQLVAPKSRLAISNSDNYVEVERPPHISYMPQSCIKQSTESPQNFFLKEVEKLINPKRNPSNTSMSVPISLEQIQEVVARKSHLQVFEGTFKPPIVSWQTTPIKIAGLGYCETKVDGLKVKGFKQTPRFSSSQLAIIFLVCYFGGKLLGGVLSILLIIPAMALLYSSLRGQGTDHKDEPLELMIPWGNIPHARFDRISGTVVINVKNFRHQKDSYKGSIFFHASVKPDHLLNALQAHRIKCKY